MGQTQGLMGKRLVAFLIDALILTLIFWVLFAILYLPIAFAGAYFILNFAIIIAGVLIVFYFTYLEGRFGATIGKTVMKLKVVSRKGSMNSKQVLIRNISKFLYFPLIIDLIVGRVVGADDRYLNKLTQTMVVLSKKDIIEIKPSLD